MIFIDTRQLYSTSDALKAVCTALHTCQDGVVSIQNHLSGTAGMEELCSSLDKAVRDIDCQIQSYRKLYQSIDGICRLYVTCENKILDYCENGVVPYETPPAEFFDLSSAIDLLREFSFTADGGETVWNQVVLK